MPRHVLVATSLSIIAISIVFAASSALAQADGRQGFLASQS